LQAASVSGIVPRCDRRHDAAGSATPIEVCRQLDCEVAAQKKLDTAAVQGLMLTTAYFIGSPPYPGGMS
jgi:hypothetical protein